MTEISRDRLGGVESPIRPDPSWLTHPWLATLLLVVIATTFALGSTLVRLAYDAGAGALSVVMTRAIIASAGLGLLLVLRRIPLRLVGRERWAAPLCGVLIAGYSSFMYLGMEYMPVALTVLTFYTYPVLTGLVLWFSGKEQLGWSKMVALPLAFLGLLLALNVSGAEFSLIGALCALTGSVGFTIVLVLSATFFRDKSDARPRTFVMLATAAAVSLVVIALIGGLAFPETALGWGALLTSAVCYAAAMAALLVVAPMIGASRTALVMNVEPIASMVLTFFILGDRLLPIQLVGAALVIGAIFLVRTKTAPAATPVPPRAAR